MVRLGQRDAGQRQAGGQEVNVSDALRQLRMFGPDDAAVFDPEDFADDIDTSTGTFLPSHWTDGIDPNNPDDEPDGPDCAARGATCPYADRATYQR
jgi:hypothetical protein